MIGFAEFSEECLETVQLNGFAAEAYHSFCRKFPFGTARKSIHTFLQ